MSQWGVQLVIGRLITDERVRRCFVERGRWLLVSLTERGLDLDDAEIEALMDVDHRVWSRTARYLHQRLRVVERKQPPPNSASRPLTGREQYVLRGIFRGLTNKQIAAQLGVSEGAVKATVQRLFHKSHVCTRAQLVRVAIEGSMASPMASVRKRTRA